MLTAVNLNNKAVIVTREVNNESSNRHLPPKTKPIQAMRAQSSP